jgi:hypothetical protein
MVTKLKLDNSGSAVGASRMDPEQAYSAIPSLLQDYINNGSVSAWSGIKQRIDNTFTAAGNALESLDKEENFSKEVKARVKAGQKLFFKPNLVTLPTIDFITHAPLAAGSCTPWEFVAAVMRWFHDRLDISYHMMSLGEGGTNASVAAAAASKQLGKTISTLALFEGRYDGGYGGWGFYFARKYLAENHQPGHSDDPMAGYEESLRGDCLPPGKAAGKLLLYDINKVTRGISGREVPVANGVNFKSITLHKAIIGGDPKNAADVRDWPGSVLVNVPKLKIHQLELLTCAVKNLGIGLYPMESSSGNNGDKITWQYARPDLPVPAFKVRVPHRRWAIAFDDKTGMPVKEKNGNYSMTRTGGMEATIADALQAVKGQNIFMMHVADAVETSNIAHTGPSCKPVPEGFVFASADPVAMDEMCVRFMFNSVPADEIEKVQKASRISSEIIQKTPLAEISGSNIVTGEGFDSAYSRYHALQYCEQRGLGKREFRVAGKDTWHGGSLASAGGRLGNLNNGVFKQLFPAAMYYTEMSLLWYLQAAGMSYVRADDKLTGSDFEKKLLAGYDENKDGVIDFLEKGKSTLYGTMPYGPVLPLLDIRPEDVLKYRFLLGCAPLRLLKKEWNTMGHCIGEEDLISNAVALAYIMSKAGKESPDPLFAGRVWGKGKWPSLQLAVNRYISRLVYGPGFHGFFDIQMTPYGQAFRYADARWNGAKYCTPEALKKNEDIIGRYHRECGSGTSPLPFVFYVPEGFGSAGGVKIPNVQETTDPGLVFTAGFDGKEAWRDLDLTALNVIKM